MSGGDFAAGLRDDEVGDDRTPTHVFAGGFWNQFWDFWEVKKEGGGEGYLKRR